MLLIFTVKNNFFASLVLTAKFVFLNLAFYDTICLRECLFKEWVSTVRAQLFEF